MNRFEMHGCRARGDRVVFLAAIGLASICALVPSLTSPASAQPAAQTSAQAWPQRPVRFILPFGAGTATDVAARLMAEKLSPRWAAGRS